MPSKIFGQRFSWIALICGTTGILFWAGSYAWIPFRLAGGRDSETVWSLIIASEIAAMIAGISSIATGILGRRYTERNGKDFIRATRGIKLGITIWIFLVTFNLIGIFFFS